MPPKDVDRMANSVDPDQTAALIKIYTVFSDIHVPIFKIFTVIRIFSLRLLALLQQPRGQ